MRGEQTWVRPWSLEDFADCARRAAYAEWGANPRSTGSTVTSTEVIRTVTRQAIVDPRRPSIEEVVSTSYHLNMTELGEYVTEAVKVMVGGRKIVYNTMSGIYDRGGMESVIRRNIQDALKTVELKWWHMDLCHGSPVRYEDELVKHLSTSVKAWQFTDSRGISRTLFIDVVGRWEDLYRVSPVISPKAFDETEEVHLLNILEQATAAHESWSRMFTLDGHQVTMYQAVRVNAAQRAMLASLSIDSESDGPGAFRNVPCNPQSRNCNNFKCSLFEGGCVEAMEVRRSAT